MRRMPHTQVDRWERMGLITSADLAELAGVTFRQLDYWCRNGVISPAIEPDGSGTRRMFHPSAVPQLTAMGRVTRAFAEQNSRHNGAPSHVLRGVAENWDRGFIDLDEGVTVSWTLPGDTARMEGHG